MLPTTWSRGVLIGGLLGGWLSCGLAFAQPAGEWRLDDSDGNIRAVYFDKRNAPADADPLLTLSCDRLNATLTGFYRNDSSALVDAARSGSLVLQLAAPQAKAALPAV